MKKLNILSITALALGGLVLTSSLAQAQENKEGRKGRPEGQGRPGGFGGQQLTEQLGLTEEQKPKVAAIMQEQGEKMRAMFGDQGGSREDRATKMRELGEATSAKLKAVLTKEQMEKYEKARTEMAGRFGGGPGGPGGFGGAPSAERLDAMAKELGLNDEQKGKIKAVYDEQAKKMEALRGDQGGSREDRMAKFRELTEATAAKIKPILTAEQQEKFAKMQQNRGPGGGQGPGQTPGNSPSRRPKQENK